MAVYETNDAGLPDFVCRHMRLIVKFTDEDCSICQNLAPDYVMLSNQEAYSDIIFLKLDAEENPIASKEVNQHGTPFVVAYRNGDLINHKLVKSKVDIVNMLDNLLK